METPPDWEEIKRIFGEAIDLKPDDRDAYIDAACGGNDEIRREVKSLLSEHEEAAHFLTSPHAVAASWAAEQDAAPRCAQLGPYRLFEVIGHGGMATVYRAERSSGDFRREVAVKVVSLAMNSEPMLQRFRLERQILADLRHPNITTLFDGGATPDGLPYLVMEYVRGVPFTQYSAAPEVSLDDCLRTFRQVCEAVQYAHEQRIVHRDLKPSNVLITADGTPKLLDFGIAKVLAETAEGEETIQTSAATRLMTPGYASPEQARGGPVTERTDVHALGLILFESVTGRPAYRVDTGNPEQLLLGVGALPPDIPSDAARRNGATPERLRQIRPGLDEIILKTLEKEPERRYATARELIDDLDRYLGGLPVQAGGHSRRLRVYSAWRRHKLRILWLGLLGLLLLLWAPLRNILTPPRLLSTGETPSAVAEANEYYERANAVEAARWDPPRIIALLDKALAADPKFAPVRVKKAFIHLIMVDGGYSADSSWLDRAESQLVQVQADSPGFSRTHSALAALAYYRRRCDQTAQYAKVALNADPKDAESRIWMVNCALIGGNFERARTLLDEVLRTAPTNFPARMNLASLFRYKGETARSAAESRRILEQDPDLIYSKKELAMALLDDGNLSGARIVLDSVLPDRQDNYHIRWGRALLLAKEGKGREALALLTPDALSWAGMVPHCAEWPAEVFATTGKPAEAMKWLKAAAAKGDRRHSWLVRNPHLASLRDRPDFKALLESMRRNLPD